MSTMVATKPPSLPARVVTRSIGKKFLMALTGVISFGFILGHMAGNLLIFVGPDAINEYGQKLVDLGPALWVIRAALLISFVAHIWLGIQLNAENSAARPINYRKKAYAKASWVSRTMIWSGLVVLAFVAYHLAHFTFHAIDPAYAGMYDAQGRKDIYTMLLTGFANPIVSVFYIIAVGLLAGHLSHGVASMFQSLGLTTLRMRTLFDRAALLFAVIVFLGFGSIPVAVLTGLVK